MPAKSFQWGHSITLIAVSLILAYCGARYYQTGWQVPDDVIVVENATLSSLGNTGTPSAKEDKTAVVQLPHDWREQSIDELQLSYFVELNLEEAPNQLWGMYIPRVTSNLRATVNGEVIGQGGRMEDPVARNWNRPLYFSIPNGQLRSGINQIQVHVKTMLGSPGYLGKFYLGSDVNLRKSYQRSYDVRVGLVQITTVGLLMAATLMFGLRIAREQDTLSFWFGLLCTIWALHNMNLLVAEIPVSVRTWETMRHLTMGWFVVVLVTALHRLLGLYYPRIEKITYCVFGIGTVVMITIPDEHTFITYTNHVWTTGVLLLGMYPFWRVSRAWWSDGSIENLVAVCTGFPILLAGAHDWLRLNGFIARDHGFFIQHSAPVLLLGFTVLLMMRYARALTISEQLTHTLEQRIETARRELQANYSRMQILEGQRVIDQERERIMRDMHDGVGGHLVSALALTEKRSESNLPVLRSVLQSALLDLRLMIDSLDQPAGDLTAVLGNVRSRMQPTLERSGISVCWRVVELPILNGVGAEKLLQIMRILQEAITNVIKHAEASVLTVSTEVLKDTVRIVIADDGCGFATELSAAGRGLRNMRYRAARAEIELQVDTDESGTRVKLEIPIQKLKLEPDSL